MREFIATPVGLIINHYNVAVSARKGQDEEWTAPQHAKFIEVAFCLIDEETDDEFYSLASTYSMN